MKNILLKYIEQRYSIVLFLSLSTYIYLFSSSVNNFHVISIFHILFVFFCLLGLRLYDDLQQVEFDKEKLNRDYTRSEKIPVLTNYLLLILCLILGLAYFIDNITFIVLLSFLLFNHLLYYLFLKNDSIRTLLPLLKYPFLVFLISNFINGDSSNYLESFVVSSIIFLGFLRFESLQDGTFLFNSRISVLFHLLSIILFIPFLSNTNNFLVILLILMVSLLATMKTSLSGPYLYLILLLLIKIYLLDYVN